MDASDMLEPRLRPRSVVILESVARFGQKLFPKCRDLSALCV